MVNTAESSFDKARRAPLRKAMIPLVGLASLFLASCGHDSKPYTETINVGVACPKGNDLDVAKKDGFITVACTDTDSGSPKPPLYVKAPKNPVDIDGVHRPIVDSALEISTSPAKPHDYYKLEVSVPGKTAGKSSIGRGNPVDFRGEHQAETPFLSVVSCNYDLDNGYNGRNNYECTEASTWADFSIGVAQDGSNTTMHNLEDVSIKIS